MINAGSGLSLGAANTDCVSSGTGEVQGHTLADGPTPDQRWNISINSDGIYSLVNDCDGTPFSLTDPNADIATGTQLTQATRDNKADQEWQLVQVDGTSNYTLHSWASNLYAGTVSNAVGARVVQDDLEATANGAPAPAIGQQWILQLVGSDQPSSPPPSSGPFQPGVAYQISNVASGLALGALGDECAARTGLVQNRYTGDATQQWNISLNGNNTYTLTNGCATTLALTDPAPSNPNTQAQLTQDASAGGITQQWLIARVGQTDNWTILSWASNQYAGTKNAAVNANVIEGTADGPSTNGLPTPGTDQQWTITAAPPTPTLVSGTTYRITNALSGFSVGAGGSCAAAIPLSQGSATGKADQAWTTTYNGDGTYTLANRCPLTMNDASTSAASGGQIFQSRDNPVGSEHWTLVPIVGVNSTTWNIINVASTQYLSASGAAGTPITRAVGDGNLDQQWTFTAVTPPALVNHPPVADAKTATTIQDQPVQIQLSGTLNGKPSSTLTFQIVDQPAHGQVSDISGAGVVTYTPYLGYSSTTPDTFTYTATSANADGDLTSVAATASVTVTAVLPVAHSQTLTTPQETPLTITLVGTGLDYNVTKYQLAAGTTAPAGLGAIDPMTGIVVYTPPVGFSGVAKFSFTVTDTRGLTSLPATVVITVMPVAKDQSITINQDQSVQITLYNATSSITGYTITTPATVPLVDVPGHPGVVTYQPKPGFTGTDSFQYTVTNGAQTSVTPTTVTITVVPVGPVATGATATVAQDGHVNITLGYSSPDFAIASINLVSLPLLGYLSHPVGYAQNVFRFDAFPGKTGMDSFQYTVTDSRPVVADQTSQRATVTIAIGQVAPVATSQQLSATADTALPITLGAASDFPIASYNLVGAAPKGLSDISSGTPTYTPPTDFSGVVSFTFTVTDSRGLTSANTATVTIDVGPAAIGQALAMTQGDPWIQITLGHAGVDPVTAFHVGLAGNGDLRTVSPGVVRYLPDPNFTGTDSFPFTVTDSTGRVSNTAVITITVANAGDTPVAQDVSATTSSGTAVTLRLFDPTSTVASYSIVGPAPAGLTDAARGSVTYTPAANFSGVVRFTFMLTNSVGTSAPATATVTVDPLARNLTLTTKQDAALTFALYDPTSSIASYVIDGASPAGLGTAVNGSVTYTPPAGFTGTVSFGYKVTDSSGLSSQQDGVVSITVTQVNPTASPQSISVSGGSAAHTITLLGVASDPANPITTYQLVGSAPAGLGVDRSSNRGRDLHAAGRLRRHGELQLHSERRSGAVNEPACVGHDHRLAARTDREGAERSRRAQYDDGDHAQRYAH